MKTKMLAFAAMAVACVAFAEEKKDEPKPPRFPVKAVIPAPKAGEGLEWVDEAIARFAENYSVLLNDATRNYTKEAPYPKTFKDGKVVYIKDWDWCSGFFQGSLWYLYEATGDAKWRIAAEKYCAEQEHVRFQNLHHDNGFMFLPSAGQGLRLTGDIKYARHLYEASRALATRWRANCKAIQAWGIWSGSWGENCSIIVDCMLNLELFNWVGYNPAQGGEDGERDWLEGGQFLDMANAHAATTIKYLLRDDGSSYHFAMLDFKTGELVEHKTGQGIGHWSRGQSWVVYGFPMMYDYTHDETYLKTAMKVADYCLTQKDVPADRIPYWDYEAPNIPNEERDSSAGAVIGCGMLRLSNLCPDKSKAAKYRAEAIRIAKSLSSPDYFAKPREIGGLVLKHAVGSKPDKAEVDVPLNYGDYYYLELLMDLKRPHSK